MDPSTDIDNPENLNFWEPSADEPDDEANPEEQEDDGIAGETDEDAGEADQETEATAEAEEQDADDAEAEKQKPKASSDDEVLVTLKGGEQVPLKELKLGYMRERDYRVKTSEVANKGRELEALSNRVTNTVDAVANFLISQLPPEPNPALAMQNTGEFVRQKTMYDAAAAQINQLIAMAHEPKQVMQELTAQQRGDLIRAENARLVEIFPQTATREG
ncbi:MAG TPA: hypothetical protein VFG14_08630, partial [Chthoniobacteraceae bacterium]|nr:hypothetical protein [Chthoniobacteraceae bacterium]